LLGLEDMLSFQYPRGKCNTVTSNLLPTSYGMGTPGLSQYRTWTKVSSVPANQLRFKTKLTYNANLIYIQLANKPKRLN